MIEFLWPLAFLLIPLPLVYRALCKPVEMGTSGAIRVPFYTLFNQSSENYNPGLTRQFNFKLTVSFLIWCLLVSAFARPVWMGEKLPLPVAGRDLMMAIDLSGSMGNEDFFFDGKRVDRLTVVKATAQDFIQRRQSDRVGLILFSNRAYLQSPLTQDHTAVSMLLDEAQVGLTGQETAIGDAIAIASKRLKEQPAKSRVLILLTDGASNTGVMQPLQAANIANELGIKIYTIGVGSAAQSNTSLFGQPLLSTSNDLDETTLKQIAQITGGKFFRAYDLKNLSSIYAELDELEPVEGDPTFLSPSVSLFFWPLGAALFLFGLFSTYLLFAGLSRRNNGSISNLGVAK